MTMALIMVFGFGGPGGVVIAGLWLAMRKTDKIERRAKEVM